jgi:hypothetical protein
MLLNNMQLGGVLVSNFYGCVVDSFPVARVWHPHHKPMCLFEDKTSFRNLVESVLGYNTFLFLALQKRCVGVAPSAKLGPSL